jgi:hypothetical protein
MNLQSFKSSLQFNEPPANINEHLKALWFDGKEDWNKSHHIAQDIMDDNGSWIHAWLQPERRRSRERRILVPPRPETNAFYSLEKEMGRNRRRAFKSTDGLKFKVRFKVFATKIQRRYVREVLSSTLTPLRSLSERIPTELKPQTSNQKSCSY